MRIQEKNQVIDSLAGQLQAYSNVYITDIGSLNVEKTNSLRRLCFKRNVKLTTVKNTLLKKAMDKSGRDFSGLYEVLEGPTSIMLCDSGNVPAKLIKEFRKSINSEKPILKGAFIEESTYIGNEMLEALVNLKTKNELIGDIVALLQSPARNVISALQSGGHKLSGIVKTLSEKSA
jgi:large subunit ribosomal protein L10